MGNPMTPFVPPAAAFVPGLITVALPTDTTTGDSPLTYTQTLNNVFKLTGTMPAAGTTGVAFPSTAPVKEYIFFGAFTGTQKLNYIGSISATQQFLILPGQTVAVAWDGSNVHYSTPTTVIPYP